MTTYKKILSRAIVLVSVTVLNPAAQAAVLEEVIVTAQKREQNLQAVGISISAFTGEQMRELGAVQSFDIANVTPGVHISGNLAGQNTQFTIRGVTQNDFNDVVEAPNAVYLDEGYIAVAQAQTFALYDIDRVEILKGPQGTLFGRNATGGLVHYISRKPNVEQADGYIDLSYGSFDTDANANSARLEAAFSGPLSGTVAARLAVMYEDTDGYLENLYPFAEFGAAGVGASQSNAPGPGAGADLGASESIAYRGSLIFNPNEDSALFVSANYASSDLSTGPYQSKPTIGVLDAGGELINVIDVSATETRATIAADGSDGGSDQGNSGTLGGPFGRPLAGGDFFGYIDPDGDDFTFSGDFAFADNGQTDTWGINAKYAWQINENLNVAWISDYKDYEKLLFIDVDSAPVNQLANYAGVDASSFTQEFRINGETDSLRWVAGFFYLNIDTESTNGLKAPANGLAALFGFDSLVGVDIGVEAELQTDSYSLFGQVEVDLAEQLTLTAGLRGIREDKDFVMDQPFYESTGNFSVHDGPLLFSARGQAFEDDTSDSLWTGKIQLDWHPREGALLYAGINRGVKAGSFNAPIPGGLAFPDSVLPYDEEVLIAYETGFKMTLMDGRTRVNGSVFYYDYGDYQAFLFTGVSGVVVNADAETTGLEFEIQTTPTDGLDLMFNIAWLDAEVQGVPYRIGSPLAPLDVEPTYAPELQAMVLARYEWAVFDGTMAIQGDMSYSDEYFYNLRNFDGDTFDEYTYSNARLSWTSAGERWQTAFLLKNITDERVGIQGFDLATLCGCNEVSYRSPRLYGVNVRYSF